MHSHTCMQIDKNTRAQSSDEGRLEIYVSPDCFYVNMRYCSPEHFPIQRPLYCFTDMANQTGFVVYVVYLSKNLELLNE